MIRVALSTLFFALAAGCGGGPDSQATDEAVVTTSEKARDILGLKLQLFDMRDRRENTGFRAWSFRLRNNEDAGVSLRIVPVFISQDGRELGGSADAVEHLLAPGAEREFYFKAPTGEAVRLVVRFEFN
ncbi:MAG: hypothetical protein HYY18_07520 [Planctomycetes bacterium]|nr:hypothetical protein [Planctomycetota bacterium]